MTVYLIDGYNLLYALRQVEGRGGTDLTPGELGDERESLLDRIASYMGGTHDRAIVVFDAAKSRLEKGESRSANVEVYFGSFSRSADSIIERETYARSSEEQIVVVTSDYAVQKTIFLPNVVRRSSRQFVRDLQEHTTKVANLSNSTRMGHRVEDRIDARTLTRLKELRDKLGEEKLGEEKNSG